MLTSRINLIQIFMLNIKKILLPIRKEWFKPHTKNLKKLIKEGRRECKRILKEIAKINM